mmetsp:Transcript_3376/g.9856  ORF Transcript_3376/g.9856 Transcript_3376/m.9856 type:complete len:206 (-) Transcript_3376:343-960(-)
MKRMIKSRSCTRVACAVRQSKEESTLLTSPGSSSIARRKSFSSCGGSASCRSANTSSSEALCAVCITSKRHQTRPSDTGADHGSSTITTLPTLTMISPMCLMSEPTAFCRSTAKSSHKKCSRSSAPMSSRCNRTAASIRRNEHACACETKIVAGPVAGEPSASTSCSRSSTSDLPLLRVSSLTSCPTSLDDTSSPMPCAAIKASR